MLWQPPPASTGEFGQKISGGCGHWHLEWKIFYFVGRLLASSPFRTLEEIDAPLQELSQTPLQCRAEGRATRNQATLAIHGVAS